jgi:hypothetical protein
MENVHVKGSKLVKMPHFQVYASIMKAAFEIQIFRVRLMSKLRDRNYTKKMGGFNIA